MTSGAGQGTESYGHDSGRRPVLEVFGMQLEVSNARLADLLTMDAKSALTTDLRGLAATETAAPVASFEAAVPPDPDDAAVLRRQFRREVLETGIALGFDVTADGTWRSPFEVSIVTRAFERPVDAATAAHYVEQLAAREEATGETRTVLLVAEGTPSVVAFSAVVRASRLHDRFRVISAADLAEVRRLFATAAIEHRQCLVLLAPAEDVDAGDLLALLRSDAPA